MFRRILWLIVVVCGGLVAVLLFNVLRLPAPVAGGHVAPAVEVDIDAAAARLGAAIALPTLSPGVEGASLQPFADLHALLQREYPRVHAALQRETIGEASLLYRWPGSDRTCAPLLLLAHQDVVPIEDDTAAAWRHGPFAGTVVDGHAWGRGALDDKGSIIAIMEAVEALLAQDFVPACDVLLAFGHDEEVGGRDGAQAIAALLVERGITPAYVLDEGGALTFGVIDGLAAPLATIGVAEKGYLSLRLKVDGGGGHSSMPPRETPIGILAGAIARIEASPSPATISPVQREMLRRIAPGLPFVRRLALANLWLTTPLVVRQFAASPTTDASMRTTTVPTLFGAGVKDNVLPQQAQAVVNLRILPSDSIASQTARITALVDDPRVQITPLDVHNSEPTTPAAWDAPAFAQIETALRAASPEADVVVAPFVTLGATDARHYLALTPNLYRFSPWRLDPALLASIHGTDERLPVAELARGVQFYAHLIRGFR